MTAYYNEIDPFAAQWLRELIRAGHIAHGDVDERSIEDVQADDLKEYTQCYFFAGIGGWSHALRLAMWPDNRPVWTGSCPCQPFSAAGKQSGGDDERHLWPVWFRLIRECGVNRVFGEQVEGAVGFGWLDRVFADLEDEGYACGAAVLGAHSVGAPHIRQRLWWVADAVSAGRAEGWTGTGDGQVAGGRSNSGLSNAVLIGQPGQGWLGRSSNSTPGENREIGGTVHACRGNWEDAGTVPCADGKARRLEPGLEPLAHGIPARVGRLRGYGNAIVSQAAAEFVGAYMDTAPC